MAAEKKSFILYCDTIHTVGHLSDEQAGKLFKHILSYVNDLNPETTDVITNLSFEPIKQQLKRDLKKWEGYIEKQTENGKLGGRPKKPTESEKTQPFFEKPKKADSVNVSVSDTVIDNDTLKEIEIGATIQYCVFNLQREYEKERVVELWQAFLINGQENTYTGRAKKIKHFRNWIKNQPYKNGTHKQTSTSGIKLGTSEARIAALKKWGLSGGSE